MGKKGYYYADFLPIGGMKVGALTPEILKRSNDVVIRYYDEEAMPPQNMQRTRWYGIFGRDFAIHTSQELQTFPNFYHPDWLLRVPNAWTFHWGIANGYSLFFIKQQLWWNTSVNLDEGDYLYPGDRVEPIEAFTEYKDYRLSEVLKVAGYSGFAECELRFARNSLPCEVTYSYLFAVAHIPDGKCIILSPSHYWNVIGPNLNTIISEKDIEPNVVSILDRFWDMRIRYYIIDGIPQRPIWVSAFIGESEQMSGIVRLFHCNPGILHGPLFNAEDEETIKSTILESPFIDYVE